jgi:hypothetical protein
LPKTARTLPFKPSHSDFATTTSAPISRLHMHIPCCQSTLLEARSHHELRTTSRRLRPSASDFPASRRKVPPSQPCRQAGQEFDSHVDDRSHHLLPNQCMHFTSQMASGTHYEAFLRYRIMQLACLMTNNARQMNSCEHMRTKNAGCRRGSRRRDDATAGLSVGYKNCGS